MFFLLQPIQALNHPKFGEMIDLASWATSGVKIPGRKSTWATIIQMFKDHLAKLKAHLNVSTWLHHGSDWWWCFHSIQGPTVAGEVSLTCDAWQASNVDGYFAVTGHWIDESVPTQWELRSALLGFTRLCNSHSGERLGVTPLCLSSVHTLLTCYLFHQITTHVYYRPTFPPYQTSLGLSRYLNT